MPRNRMTTKTHWFCSDTTIGLCWRFHFFSATYGRLWSMWRAIACHLLRRTSSTSLNCISIQSLTGQWFGAISNPQNLLAKMTNTHSTSHAWRIVISWAHICLWSICTAHWFPHVSISVALPSSSTTLARNTDKFSIYFLGLLWCSCYWRCFISMWVGIRGGIAAGISLDGTAWLLTISFFVEWSQSGPLLSPSSLCSTCERAQIATICSWWATRSPAFSPQSISHSISSTRFSTPTNGTKIDVTSNRGSKWRKMRVQLAMARTLRAVQVLRKSLARQTLHSCPTRLVRVKGTASLALRCALKKISTPFYTAVSLKLSTENGLNQLKMTKWKERAQSLFLAWCKRLQARKSQLRRRLISATCASKPPLQGSSQVWAIPPASSSEKTTTTTMRSMKSV